MTQTVLDSALVDAAITSRMAVRAFTSAPVERQTVADLLQVASRAPSGTNMQPWKVYVVTGERLKAVSDAVLNSGVRAEKIDNPATTMNRMPREELNHPARSPHTNPFPRTRQMRRAPPHIRLTSFDWVLSPWAASSIQGGRTRGRRVALEIRKARAVGRAIRRRGGIICISDLSTVPKR